MKLRFYISGILLLLSFPLVSQISYQAVVRDENGNVQTNEEVSIGVSIMQNSEVIYSEDHPNLNSGILGIINLSIGNGENASGNFGDIDWSLTNYELNIDINGTPLPSSPINSVPIAEYAKASPDGHWNWDEEEQVLNFTNGRVAINTNDIGNSNFKIQGDPNYFPLSISQGGEGSNHGILIASPNSNYSGRINMWNDVFSLGRGNNGQILSILSSGKIGINTTNPASSLQVNGLSTLTHLTSSTILKLKTGNSSLDAILASYNENNTREWFINMCDRSEGDRFGIYSEDFGGYVLNIEHSGQTSVKCLKIEGGCDITEPFATASDKKIDPGMVVVMTEKGIELSEKSHDPRVVGVISGANGVNTGMQLSQNELFDEGLPVAIAGRVYVKTAGSVKIGDLLVSAEEPGVAMAEKEMSRAFNRTIGKALSKPDKNGFVLMLVNIQ